MEGDTYRTPDEALMALDPGLVPFVEEADAADAAGGDELDRQDGVDLADELVADIDGGLGDGAAKLEVVRDVVLAAPGRAAGAEQTLRLVAGGRALGVGGRGGGVVFGLVLGRALVFGRGGHGLIVLRALESARAGLNDVVGCVLLRGWPRSVYEMAEDSLAMSKVRRASVLVTKEI